jgi:hypothetical protein
LDILGWDFELMGLGKLELLALEKSGWWGRGRKRKRYPPRYEECKE